VTALYILLKTHISEDFNKVEVTYSLLDLDQDIRLKFECVASDHQHKRTHRGINEDRKSLSEKKCIGTWTRHQWNSRTSDHVHMAFNKGIF